MGSAKVVASRLEHRADIQVAIAEARREPSEPEPQTARALPAAGGAMTPYGQAYSAESYLQAVVAGTERPDPVRVGAAKALIAYQQPRSRRPLPPERSPTQQMANEVSAAEREQREAWSQRVVEIRSRLRKPGA
jgi:hypothetical protein